MWDFFKPVRPAVRAQWLLVSIIIVLTTTAFTYWQYGREKTYHLTDTIWLESGAVQVLGEQQLGYYGEEIIPVVGNHRSVTLTEFKTGFQAELETIVWWVLVDNGHSRPWVKFYFAQIKQQGYDQIWWVAEHVYNPDYQRSGFLAPNHQLEVQLEGNRRTVTIQEQPALAKMLVIAASTLTLFLVFPLLTVTLFEHVQ